MSDQFERPASESGEEATTNIRRVGAKDRKPRLEPAGPLFPPETTEAARAIESAKPAAPPALATRPRSISRQRKGRGNWAYNLITLLFVVATLAAIAYVAFLWNNYQSPLNPFAPPTPLPIFVTATPGP